MVVKLLRGLSTSVERMGILPDDPEELRLQKTILVLSSLMMASLAIVWGTIYLALGQSVGASIPLSYSALSFLGIGIFARTHRYRLFRTSQLLLSLFLPFFLLIALGGFVNSSAVVLWSLTSPVSAILFVGRRQATSWFLAYLALVLSSGLVDLVASPLSQLPQWSVVIFFVMNISGVSAVAFSLLQYFLHQKERAHELLRIEQEKSEGLLLNVLPKEIAPILKESQSTIADRFEAASILFADVVDFTVLSAEMSPEEMVELLNEIFSHFDKLVEQHDVEKIRTMGDSYMVASGVPRPRADHAHALASVALGMTDYLKAPPVRHGKKIRFRVGISSGPVVAGVIGRRRFRYDVWGNTVNLASRMEAQGAPGKIQIARSTRDLIHSDFKCEPRGMIDVKGMEKIETWYLVGRR